MTQKLHRQQLERLLEQAREAFPHETCLTCECFLGYVAQLGIDADEDVAALLAEMGIERERTHSCLGCDPCPPADLFANYLRQQNR